MKFKEYLNEAEKKKLEESNKIKKLYLKHKKMFDKLATV